MIAVICHAAMTGYTTKMNGDVVEKTGKIGTNGPTLKDLTFLPDDLRAGEFPDEAVPKCLYEIGGEVVLETTVQILREFNINRIIFVAGYKKDQIEQFNREKNLGMEVRFNPEWGDYNDSTKTFRVGIEGLDDDLLILLGDAFLSRKVMDELLSSVNPLAMSYGHVFKVAKTHLNVLDGIKKGGTYAWGFIEYRLAELLQKNGAEIVSGISDLDYYSQTDEYKRKVMMFLHGLGWSYETMLGKVPSYLLDTRIYREIAENSHKT